MTKDQETEDSPNATDGKEAVSYWLKELEAHRKREEKYREHGEKILKIYDGTNSETVPFNILFSNTETLLPAVYSSIPRPVVQRRFKDEDPIGKAASDAAKRVLEFLIDTDLDGYETFDETMRYTVLDGLLPGRGHSLVKYDATMNEGEAKEGEEATPYLQSELVCLEAKQWNRVYYGYAKRWSTVPWVAYEEYIDKDEAEKKFGKEKADELTYAKTDKATGDKHKSSTQEQDTGERKTVCVYQIWDKDGGRKIRWVCEQYKDGYLKVDEDPLGLTGFFNCPRPLRFVEKTHSLVPTSLYKLYESQANELNEITRRLKKLVKVLKARGLYAGDASSDIQKLMEADDNELVPADNISTIAAEKGLQNAVWFWPIEIVIVVVEKLLLAREQCKQTIYEITGIADIMRGSTKASETATAQNIKDQWGTLRLKRLQKEVARYAVDTLRLMLEIAATKFSEETWSKMTGLPFLLEPKFLELQAVSQALQQQLQAQPPMPLQTPWQPTPPNPLEGQLQQIQEQLKAPKWADILQVLRDDLSRAFRIDIETNSTVEPEAAEDQKHIQEVLMAMGQYLQGVAPLILNGAMPFQAAQAMLLTIVRRFRFGSDIEEYIKAMQQPKPPDENGAEQVKKEKEMAQKEVQFQQKESEMALKQKAMDVEMQQKEREMNLQMREAQLKVDQDVFKMEQQASQQSMQLKEQASHQKLQHEKNANTMQQKQFQTEKAGAQKAETGLAQEVRELRNMVRQLMKQQVAA